MSNEKKYFDEDCERGIRLDYWNRMAEDYNDRATEKPDSVKAREDLMKMLLERDILRPGFSVLDLGCGPGKFSKMFAEVGISVVGIDVSPKMLEYAKENTKGNVGVRFIEADWGSYDLTGQEKCFDLVFAHMSPAIYNPFTLKKMMLASKSWCYFSHFTKREDPIKEELRKILGGEQKGYLRVPSVEKILLSLGIVSEKEIIQSESRRRLTLNKAIENYSTDFLEYGDVRKEIETVLGHYAVDGEIEKVVKTEKVSFLWQIKK
ncbi:MAG: methyltransferase domain-containing protein [Eubacterium sp.]